MCGRCWRPRQAAAAAAASQAVAGAQGAALADQARWAEVEAALPKVLLLLCVEYSLPRGAAGLEAMFLRIAPGAVGWALQALGARRVNAERDAIISGAVFGGDPAVMAQVAELGPGLVARLTALRPQELFSSLCARGRLPALQWLCAQPGGREALRRHAKDGLRYACEYGHLETAKWVAQSFELSRAALRAHPSVPALERACANGHAGVVNWFMASFVVSEGALRGAAVRAADEGHHAIAMALMSRLQLFRDELEQRSFFESVDSCRADLRILCRAALEEPDAGD